VVESSVTFDSAEEQAAGKAEEFQKLVMSNISAVLSEVFLNLYGSVSAVAKTTTITSPSPTVMVVSPVLNPPPIEVPVEPVGGSSNKDWASSDAGMGTLIGLSCFILLCACLGGGFYYWKWQKDNLGEDYERDRFAFVKNCGLQCCAFWKKLNLEMLYKSKFCPCFKERDKRSINYTTSYNGAGEEGSPEEGSQEGGHHHQPAIGIDHATIDVGGEDSDEESEYNPGGGGQQVEEEAAERTTSGDDGFKWLTNPLCSDTVQEEEAVTAGGEVATTAASQYPTSLMDAPPAATTPAPEASIPISQPIQELSVEEVCTLVKSLGIDPDPFMQNSINGEMLDFLTDEDLQEDLGLSNEQLDCLRKEMVARGTSESPMSESSFEKFDNPAFNF